MKTGQYVEVERTCRYGHGRLVMENSVTILPTAPEWKRRPEGTPISAPTSFVAHLYRCKTCGYLELADFNAGE